MAEVLDLDVLRPEAKLVKLGTYEIDVSFIPCGITFDVDELVNELAAYTEAEVKKGGEKARKAFDLSVKLCALFCAVKHPDLNEEWFRENTSPVQIEMLAKAISETLTESYTAMEGYQKN